MAVEAAQGGAMFAGWRPRPLYAALSLALLLSAIGLGVATYLTVVHYAHQPIACNGIGDCEYVNSSEYAELAGLPVAVLGGVAYASILLLTAAAWVRRDAMLLLGAWGVALASWGFSAYLTYIELAVLDAICVYCVVSATVVTALLAVLSVAHWLTRDDTDFAGEDGEGD